MKMCLHQQMKLILLDRDIQNKNKPRLDFFEEEVKKCGPKLDIAKKMLYY